MLQAGAASAMLMVTIMNNTDDDDTDDHDHHDHHDDHDDDDDDDDDVDAVPLQVRRTHSSLFLSAIWRRLDFSLF